MNQKHKKIGLIIGREWDWPDAFMQGINESDQDITAELIKLGGTFMNESCDYHLIIDRMSHEIPYYRVYLKFAAVHGVYIINNPFTLSADNKFFSVGLMNRLGFNSPRTVLLPNKHVDRDVVADSFRNLQYPMNWQKIIDYVGVPAIIKDNHTGGRRRTFRVHNVDELIQRYDQSSTRTKILQQLIESDTHIHCFVFGQENVLVLQYSLSNDAYLPEILAIDEARQQKLAQDALKITQAYKYDSNMVEFVLEDDTAYVINGTNPAPAIDRKLMTEEQFNRCVQQMIDLALHRVKRPLPQEVIFRHILEDR